MIDRENRDVLEEVLPLVGRCGVGEARFRRMLEVYLRDERGSDEHVARAKRVFCWYRSVAEGRPDDDVYLGAYYLVVAWQSWVEWSRKYLRILRGKLLEHLPEVDLALDLGCGLGLSTAALRSIFPGARVAGTNLRASLQWRVAEEMSARYGFELVEDCSEVPEPDLVLASEYFEHFVDPVAHLREVLDARPRSLAIASAFGAVAVGHFPEYELDGRAISPTKIGRAFNAELRAAGYAMVKHGAWNNRPNLWVR